MKQELIVTGSTIEEALRNGAEQLGVMPEELKYEVLVEPKKGILGIGRVAAKLKVCYEEAEAPAEKTTSVAKTAPAKRTETAEENNVALRFVRTLLEDMELEAEATIEGTDGEEKNHPDFREGRRLSHRLPRRNHGCAPVSDQSCGQ